MEGSRQDSIETGYASLWRASGTVYVPGYVDTLGLRGRDRREVLGDEGGTKRVGAVRDAVLGYHVTAETGFWVRTIPGGNVGIAMKGER
eukprot:227906-Pleurochrysis_carterae.AAC.2